MIWPFRIRTVRARLLIAAILVETVMLTLMVGNGLRVLSSSLETQAEIQAEQLVPVLQAALITPLAQRDHATVQAILDESRISNALDYLAVEDARGRVIAISGWDKITPLPAVDTHLSFDEKAPGIHRFDVGAPVGLLGQDLGRLQFGMNLDEQVAALHTQFSQSLAIATAEIALSAALLTGIGIWLTRHLTAFTRMSEAVGHGNYHSVEMIEGEDDIGRLGRAFNAMSRAVHERVEELTVAIRRREDAEAELRASESRFRDLAASASDWFWETDEQGRLTYASERISSVLGVSPAEVIGLSWFDLGLNDLPEMADQYRHDLAGRSPFRDLTINIGPPGGKDFRTVRVSGAPAFDADGHFTGYRGVGADITREGGVVSVRTDITELKRREVELDILRRRYALILGAAGEGILGLDRDGRVTFANPAAAALLDYPDERMIGTGLIELLGDAAPGNQTAAAPGIVAACRGGCTRTGRGQIVLRGNSQPLPIDYYIGPIIDAGEIDGAVLLVRDAAFRLHHE